MNDPNVMQVLFLKFGTKFILHAGYNLTLCPGKCLGLKTHCSISIDIVEVKRISNFLMWGWRASFIPNFKNQACKESSQKVQHCACNDSLHGMNFFYDRKCHKFVFVFNAFLPNFSHKKKFFNQKIWQHLLKKSVCYNNAKLFTMDNLKHCWIDMIENFRNFSFE